LCRDNKLLPSRGFLLTGQTEYNRATDAVCRNFSKLRDLLAPVSSLLSVVVPEGPERWCDPPPRSGGRDVVSRGRGWRTRAGPFVTKSLF
jgi:hypothetical protein